MKQNPLHRLQQAHRRHERILGFVLSAVGIIPALFGLSAAYDLAFARDMRSPWISVTWIVVAVSVTWWCELTGWRLRTGRERPGGGLFPAWVMYLAGTAVIAVSTYRSMAGDPTDPARKTATNDLFGEARARRMNDKTKGKTA